MIRPTGDLHHHVQARRNGFWWGCCLSLRVQQELGEVLCFRKLISLPRQVPSATTNGRGSSGCLNARPAIPPVVCTHCSTLATCGTSLCEGQTSLDNFVEPPLASNGPVDGQPQAVSLAGDGRDSDRSMIDVPRNVRTSTVLPRLPTKTYMRLCRWTTLYVAHQHPVVW